ncbi:MAG: Fur family transcriptional regulator [Verrucomicrobiia bacterium]
MRTAEKQNKKSRLDEKLKNRGLKLTRRRRLVYEVLLEKKDHPTADAVFFRARKKQPDISIATVYNCLDALVKCGLVRQVKVDKNAIRYCTNLTEHAHFVCEICGAVIDINLNGAEKLENIGIKLPKGFRIKDYEIALRGVCCGCKI